MRHGQQPVMIEGAEGARAARWRLVKHPGALAGLERELARWAGTPFRFGHGVPGPDGGVDCIHLIGAVLDGVRQKATPTPVQSYPAGHAVNNPQLAWERMRDLVETFAPIECVRDGSIEPGDVLAVAAKSVAGPHHLLLAGVGTWDLWEAIKPQHVAKQGRGRLMRDLRVLRTWRPTDKATWR